MGTIVRRKAFHAASMALLALFFTAPIAVSAQYYTYSDRPGYYWGKDAPPPEEPEAPEPKQAPAPAEKQEPKKDEAKKEDPKKYEWENREEISFSEFTPQQIWDMRPKEFSALFDAFQQQSVWRPTESHVHDTYAMIDMARRKAAAYTNVQQLVMQNSPDLSTERDYPSAVPGKDASRGLKIEEINSRVATAAGEYGLLYFYKPGCPYCEAESKILGYFEASRHFEVERVNIYDNPGLASELNITITPSLVLIKRGSNTPIPISYGVIALDELETRVFDGVRLYEGETTPEQYGVREYERGGAFDPTAPLHR